MLRRQFDGAVRRRTARGIAGGLALIAVAALSLHASKALSAARPALIHGREMEQLDRGVIAVPAISGRGNLVSWRQLETDAPGTSFFVYRNGRRINREPTSATNLLDESGGKGAAYSIGAVVRAHELPRSRPAIVEAAGYIPIPLDPPAGGLLPDGTSYTYEANDASVGDLDGDGRYEIVLKWYPTSAKDNAFGGYTGNTIFDAYTLDGRKLWRIDMGPNIRSGAHYTQFLVYDLDGDGRAEVVAKTADGTIDGTGRLIGNAHADWRERGGMAETRDRTGAEKLPDGRNVERLTGRILRGPEYLTVFDGRTGRAVASVPFQPARHPATLNPTGEQLKQTWGDAYGNRSERYLAAVAYLDGRRPSIVMARGYYARTTLAAWDLRGGRLAMRWMFDSALPGNERFSGQGNHQLSVADVDGDGRDEIIYGSMAVDDNGRGLWSAGLFHGDAMHVSDLDPNRPGLEKWGVHEEVTRNGGIGAAMLDARTGEVLWTTKADRDTGRGLAADIDPRYSGDEVWGSNSPDLFDVRGHRIGHHPRQVNFAIWWDGDLSRELLDGTRIFKWDYERGESVPLLDPAGVASDNGTKANPVLSADIIGDWREELILRSADNKSLRIYITPYPTNIRLPTLMQDPVYRLGVAWQNVAYNQPPHTSYFLGSGMKAHERGAK